MSMEILTYHDPDSANRVELYYSFDHFDPITGDVAPLKFSICTNIVFRARQLLKVRTREQLDYALATLNWMLTQINISSGNTIVNMLIELDKREAAGEEIGEDDFTLPTEVNTLNLCMETFDIEGQELLPNAKWHEYFAILAIGKIDLAFENKAELSTGDSTDEQLLLTTGSLLIEAMEAVRSAEVIKETEAKHAGLKEEVKELKEKVSLRNKTAAIKRHEKTSQLFLELVAFYDAGDYKTYTEATQKFLETIPEKRIEHLAPTNLFRTLCEGLSAIKRGKRDV